MLDRFRLAAFAALALTTACSGHTITTDRDSSVPLPASPTWAWGRRDTVSQYELDPGANNPMLHQRVGRAIEENLTRRGWRKVDDPAQANVLVTYHIGIKRDTEVQTTSTSVGMYGGGWYGGYGWGYYGAPAYGGMSTTRAVEYRTGGLLIYVREASSNRVAWYGLFKKDVHDVSQVTDEGIHAAVNATLAQLKS